MKLVYPRNIRGHPTRKEKQALNKIASAERGNNVIVVNAMFATGTFMVNAPLKLSIFQENNIVALTLPTHSSHKMDPLI